MEEIKTYSIIWAPSFKNELSNMLYYISNILQEPKIARKTLKLITRKLEQLKYFPEINSKFFIQNTEFRKLILKKYIVIYQIDSQKNEIYILHIFHGNQNYLSKI